MTPTVTAPTPTMNWKEEKSRRSQRRVEMSNEMWELLDRYADFHGKKTGHALSLLLCRMEPWINKEIGNERV